MTYRCYSLRPVEAESERAAAEIFAGRIARRRLGRLAKFEVEHYLGNHYLCHPRSKRRPNCSPVSFFVST